MKVLINWDYTRQDLVSYFNKLDSRFELIFIRYFSKEEDPVNNFPHQVIYWGDFRSPYELLKSVQPDKIIFHDIESFSQVSLNIASKKKGIPTYVLEHGLRLASEIKLAYHDIKPLNSTVRQNSGSKSQSAKTLKFYLSCLSLSDIFLLPKLLRFSRVRKKYGLTIGLHKFQGEFREADHYINFTEFNASYIRERDAVPERKFIYIGNPSQDELLSKLQQQPEPSDYYLLLDSPLVEDFGMNLDVKKSFLEKLSSFCGKEGRKLYVKLHPKSFGTDYNTGNPNIRFFKDADLTELINGSAGIIGVYLSTLSPIAMVARPYLHVATPLSGGIEDCIGEFYKIMDFDDFEEEKIHFHTLNKNEKEKVVAMFLYSMDGKAKERLTALLLNEPR